ncbi:class F sortase [Streptomyces sp. NBC_01257]|uniref:class F sortase n=1 Tax=Streptomyces sp. NBC_01257 TaxID=2903799 RepID=UPI002DD828BE|nr:class F sortase [Streptomyces sp. NBC_01257]WRZ65622.1 class F sortase [Streptomyces sp. NBC_01257]
MTSPAATGRPPSNFEGGRPRRNQGHHPKRRRRIIAAVAVATGIGLGGAGTWVLLDPTTHAVRDIDIGEVPVQPGSDNTITETAPAAPPQRIRIASIGLDKPLTGLRVQQDGTLAAPGDPADVGWWSDGPRPGDPGAAVFVGHVDSATGPAAFYGLSSLRPGDRITIRSDNGRELAFTVRALRSYEKDAFPDSQVYATTGPPALRLITCGGTYDRTQGEYRDNLVVYATLAR